MVTTDFAVSMHQVIGHDVDKISVRENSLPINGRIDVGSETTSSKTDLEIFSIDISKGFQQGSEIVFVFG